jgi:hypothetical protein
MGTANAECDLANRAAESKEYEIQSVCRELQSREREHQLELSALRREFSMIKGFHEKEIASISATRI